MLKKMIRNHIEWSVNLSNKLASLEGIEIVTNPILSLFTFRFTSKTEKDLNVLNERILKEINEAGEIYLTPTTVDGKYVIRFVTGTLESNKADVDFAYDVIKKKIPK